MSQLSDGCSLDYGSILRGLSNLLAKHLEDDSKNRPSFMLLTGLNPLGTDSLEVTASCQIIQIVIEAPTEQPSRCSSLNSSETRAIAAFEYGLTVDPVRVDSSQQNFDQESSSKC